MQTLPLKTIIQRWRDVLAASDDIKFFCLGRFGKEPTIFVGINGKDPPSIKHCPYILIYPGTKTEGLEEDVYTYTITVGWSIVKDEIDISMSGVVQYPGVYDSDDFGQLIYKTLAEASNNYPVTRMTYDIETVEFVPQFPGLMHLEIQITPAIGGQIEF